MVSVSQFPPSLDILEGTEQVVAYSGGVPVTLTTEQIADLAGGSINYALQWAVWFNTTPSASELLALYVSPVNYQYAANFAGSFSAAPLTPPGASFVLTVNRQFNGAGAWAAIGTITISTAGAVTLATTGGMAIVIGAGDRLQVVGPSIADTLIAGFAATLKGTPV